jgi:DNA-binding transcriptional ArsR family regulator
MIDELDGDDWADLIDAAEPPTAGAVIGVLSDRLDVTGDDAERALEDALDGDAPITLDADAGMFGRVSLVDDGGNDAPVEDGDPDDEDHRTGDENPTPEPSKPPDGNTANLQSGGDELVSSTDRLDRARPSGRSFYPDEITAREWWINWVMALPFGDDGEVDEDGTPTKQPAAPYDNGHARPTKWNSGLDDDEHPCTDFEDVLPWAGLSTTVDIHAPDRVVSDELGLGIILPVNQGSENSDRRKITLIDWDDVRDPETGEIHPVVGRALAAVDCYAEISQSGEGIHQFVFGEIPGGFSKFIRHIDDEPFIGDDLPAVEMYESGRVCAMTGDHVAGSGEDVVDAQGLIDRLCWEFGTAGNAGPGTPSDPYGRRSDDLDASNGTGAGDDGVPDHETVGETLQDAAAYDGPDPDDWETPDDWSLEYAAVLRARKRSDELAGVANWELLGYAAAYGYRDDRTKTEILDDLRDHPTPQYGFDETRARKEIRGVFRKADAGNYQPPSRATLAHRGILPDRYADDGAGDGFVVSLPDEDDLEDAVGDDDEGDDERAVDAVGDPPAAGEITVADARARTKATITDAYRGDDDVLVEALPSMGKSYGSVAAAVETSTTVTILTGRGRKEQYDQIRAWADELGLDVGTKGEPDGDVFVLPAFQSDCNTANGDHGDDWADRVDDWYSAGATPAEIHAQAETTLRNDPEIDHDDHDHDGLPCQADGRCDYTRRWDFDPDDFQILVGHYAHGHKPKVTTDRVVVVDEFPDAYETTLGDEQLSGAVTRYLQEYDRLPYENWTDLVANRDDHDRRADALGWLENRGVTPDELGAIRFDDEHKHALAPVAIYVILKAAVGGTLGNGYERADLPHDRAGIGILDDGGDRITGKAAVHLLRPARGLSFADHVVGLDGTPTPDMWELATGLDLDHETVLDGRRAEYLEIALGLRIVRTTDAVKPYNNDDHVHTSRDAALLEAITKHHGDAPAVITTSTARYVWDDAGVIDYNADEDAVEDGPVSGLKIHGNVLGSNRFQHERLGCLVGSNHYGDGFVKRWGAYAGKAVTRESNPTASPDETPLSYGDFGDRILQHMREHDTLQAVMRFGRDADGATVYVDTNTLPDWAPVHGIGDVTAAADGMIGVLRALDDLRRPGTADLIDHDAVDVSRRQVRNHLSTLRELEVVDAAADPDDGRRTVDSVSGDEGVAVDGFADLPAVEDAGESSGNTTYSNTTIRETSGKSELDDAVTDGGDRTVDDGGDRPTTTDEDDPPAVDDAAADDGDGSPDEQPRGNDQ